MIWFSSLIKTGLVQGLAKKGAWLMTSIKKIAQGCQGGTRQILEVDTQNYQFQQKNCIHTQLDSYVKVFLDYIDRRSDKPMVQEP